MKITSLFCKGAFASLCLWASTLATAAVPDALLPVFKDARIPVSAVSLWVAPAQGGKASVQHNAEQPMNPASVMKLLTSYAALDTLSPAYTWKTSAWLDGSLQDGKLSGNVLIAASGDPDLSWDRIGQWLRDWRTRGLRDIQGDIVIDRSLYPQPDTNAQFDDAPHRAYNAQPDAFLSNFGALSVRLSVTPEGNVNAVSLTPSAPLRIQNRLRNTNAPCPGWRDGLGASFRPEGQGFVLNLEGRFPASCGEKVFNLAVSDSARWTAAIIRAQWQELGGSWNGNVRYADLPATLSAAPFSVWTSPELSEVLRDMDKWSNNVMARMVFLTLGQDDSKTPLSLARTQARLIPWMAQQGLDPTQWILENGSGLSRSERTTAAQLGLLLQSVWRSPRMPDFVAALPITGMDGTMRSRLPNTPIAGRGYIKTGTLDGVKSLAGYMLNANGQWQAFALLINHPNANGSETLTDNVLQWLYAGNY